MVSGRPTTAVGPSTRKSVESASSRPPPRAGPLMAEMVGMGRWERDVKVWRREVRNCVVCWGVKVMRSLRSAPLEKQVVGWAEATMRPREEDGWEVLRVVRWVRRWWSKVVERELRVGRECRRRRWMCPGPVGGGRRMWIRGSAGVGSVGVERE